MRKQDEPDTLLGAVLTALGWKKDTTHILVNGKEASSRYVVQDGDVVALLPPDIRLAAPFIGEEEAAALFRVDVATWREWDATGLIPAAVEVAGLPRWDEAELQAWYESGAPPRSEWEAKKRDDAQRSLAPLRLMSTPETAAYIGVGTQTVKNDAPDLAVARRSYGKRVLYDRATLDRILDRMGPGHDVRKALRRASSASARVDRGGSAIRRR